MAGRPVQGIVMNYIEKKLDCIEVETCKNVYQKECAMKNFMKLLVLLSVKMQFCCGMTDVVPCVKIPPIIIPSLQDLCANVVMNPNVFRRYEKKLVRSDGKYNFSTTFKACLPIQFNQAKTIREICCSICAAYELGQEIIISEGIDKLLMQTPILCAKDIDLSKSFFVLSDQRVTIDMSGAVIKIFAERLKQKVQQAIKADRSVASNLKDKLIKSELTFEENLWILSFCLQGDAFNNSEIVALCFSKVDDKKNSFKTEVQEFLCEKIEPTRTKIPVYQWSLNHSEKIKKRTTPLFLTDTL